jgi:DNA-binding transcriptional LysR family regulator
MISYHFHMISRRELALLRAMYQHDTVTAAAASVHMSQPAASALLRDLETRLGLTLFNRDNRRLRLTTQGRVLIPEVLHALSAMDAVDRLALDLRRSTLTRLTVGAVAAASTVILPDAVQRVLSLHPQLSVTVRSGSAVEIVDMAIKHEIDLGIVITESSLLSERIAQQPLANLCLYGVFHPNHPRIQDTRALSLEEAATMPLVTLSQALPAGRETLRAFTQAGLQYRPLLEVSQSITACEMVRAGAGIAVVESIGAMYATKQGLIIRPLHVPEHFILSLVWPQDKPLADPAQSLCDALATVFVDPFTAIDSRHTSIS